MLCRAVAILLAFCSLSAIAQAPEPAAARAAQLDTLFHDIWEDRLKRSPVFASEIGDLRYNDQLPDLSPRAVNDRLAAQHGFLIRLLSIDTSGLAAPQRVSFETMQREFLQDEEAAPFKQWELPVNRDHGIQTDLPGMAGQLRFGTVKDYDDYIARLHLVPRQLRQASENLLAGIDDHRVEPADVIEQALKQTEELAVQTPAESAFASPLKKFPAAIDGPNRKRITADLLDAIQTDVLPAYVRFAKFLRVTEAPAAKDSVAAPDRPLSYEADETKILELRDRASSTLGPKFDVKAFDDIVNSSNGLPTDVLERKVSAWTASN